ncbi:hypothetical protein [Staphylococcus sp. EZ-P03]|uniref:hypothetical protein n=1 Tax=Staphylococcus sp. EZ-P03 TaxID=2282739 RepID=UPI000DF7FFD0|nr:hypothetical protein [Staphylococcus sp. EZ-P03]
MNEVEVIVQEIEKLFENHPVSKIAKGSNVPDQTVRDLKNGKSDIMKSKFQTVAKLYHYQNSLEKKN